MEELFLQPEYLPGTKLLDAQSEVVLNCLSKIQEEILAGKTETELFGLIARTDAYCKLHFMDEEKVMEGIGYPEMSKRIAQDAAFIRHLERVFGEFRELSATKMIDKILFLKAWFLEHIRDFDKKCSEYSKSGVIRSGLYTAGMRQ